MLFVSDLDGTLLDHTHKIDDIVLDGIRKILAAGHYFVICTGRSLHKAEEVNFGIDHEHMFSIGMNGAIIYKDHRTILDKKAIDKDVVSDAIDVLSDDIFVRYETRLDSLYTYSYDEADAYLYKEHIFEDIHEDRMAFYAINSKFSTTKDEILAHDIYKINFSMSSAKAKKTADDFIKRHPDKIVNAPWGEGFYDITDIGADKAIATKWLADYLDIPYDEVYTYGDSYNDLELMLSFKNSYAPSNAIDLIKDAAKHVIGDYDDHSVIKDMLEKIAQIFVIDMC